MRRTITLLCDDCSFEFVLRGYEDGDDLPECPVCEASAKHIPGAPALIGSKAKAVDTAFAIAETMGMTDMQDNQREGDIAFKGPAPMQGAERETIMREIVQAGVAAEEAQKIVNPQASNYWQGGMPGGGDPMAVARQVSKDSVDAVGLLEKGRDTGSMPPIKLNVMGRARG
jgi:hypothetical protein